jgi:ubiquinone biosynthesis accessory factor UbiK
MAKPDFLKKLAQEITESLPAHFQAFKKDLDKNCHLTLKKVFSKLDVVSREEFDVQSKVLTRTRKKIEELEEMIKHLEKKKHKS